MLATLNEVLVIAARKTIRMTIGKGIRKINYYSYMAREGVFAADALLKEKNITFYHDVALAAATAMENDAARAMKVFYSK
ncbi:hypothetical protein P22_2703 [Propionispora sp. 2/2-37]|uniref:hypothetical protein n=1 Tax=Propionispora sp. 2/2-37 TaxID=1677858 RepID=UPI0006BB84B8|nr:hypothetical protein [Propionispora sp. 2/2-37]CUH96613.1 hypothetical protein P22_2703 [Propionispora sp. 2/2-37]